MARGEDAPAVPYCWLSLGSEARRKQTLRTDQDDGLVYEDPPTELRAAAETYFASLAATAVEMLVAVGFPPCPGGSVASNAKWCQPVSVWAGYFRRWMREPEPEPVLAAQIHFDLRPIGGTFRLGYALKQLIEQEAPGHRLFLRALAREIVTRRAPITIFGNVRVERRGPRRGTVDLKGRGTFQLAGAGRVLALELGGSSSAPRRT